MSLLSSCVLFLVDVAYNHELQICILEMTGFVHFYVIFEVGFVKAPEFIIGDKSRFWWDCCSEIFHVNPNTNTPRTI